MSEETSNPVATEAGPPPAPPAAAADVPPTPPAEMPVAAVEIAPETPPPPPAVDSHPPEEPPPAPAAESQPPAETPAEEPPAPEPVAEAPPTPEPEPEPEPVAAVEAKQAPAKKPEPEPEPAAPAAEAPKEEDNKKWYVVKVQSGREETIKEAIERRVKIEGLEEFYGQIHIPVEKVTEVRNNRRYVKSRKLYPGYIMANVEYNDRILYLFRETSGVGDFVGGSINKPPQPMKPREVESMMGPPGGVGTKEVPVKHKFSVGDRVRVRDGTFAGMEGEIKEVVDAKNAVKVELTIFGRPVPVELEPWQVETQ